MANSKIYLGSTNIGSLFQGADDISIYLGENKVYPLAFKLKTMINAQKALNLDCTEGNTTLSSSETHPSTAYTLYTSASIGECVDTIGEGAFSGYTSMTSITIPNTITSIGNYAFQACLHLSDYSIPSGVTSIGSNAFNSCEHITSITIPDSVTSIGSYAFYSCNRATSLSIGSGLTSIGDNVFYNCTGLTSVNIPDTITSIGSGAFQYCRGLNSINIGNGVTTIGYYAFNACSSATSISIGSGVTTIRSEAFAGCTALTSITIDATTPPTLGSNVFYNTNDCAIYVPCESVDAYKSASGWSDYASRITCPSFGSKWKATYSDSHVESAQCGSSSAITRDEINLSNLVSVEIGDCVTSIDNYVFQGCSSLRSCTIPNSVTSIGERAFLYCSSLTSIDIPSGVRSIGYGAFGNCTGLTSINIPSGATSIDDRVFYGCSSLTSIDIPSDVTRIGFEAFSGCSSLTSIKIPSDVTRISDEAFAGCSGLTAITIDATVPPMLEHNVFDNTNDCPIIVSCSSVDAYKSESGWSDYASRITCVPSCNDLVLPDGDNFTANTTDKSIQIPYGGVSSKYIKVTECGQGYLKFNSIDSKYIYLDIVNSPKDGDSDCIDIEINGDKCIAIYVGFVDSSEKIPTGTDMARYYGMSIKRIVINDTTIPSNFNQCMINDWNSQSWININQWSVSSTGEFGHINSLPIDSTPTHTVRLEKWEYTDGSYQQSTINPFNDLRIVWEY